MWYVGINNKKSCKIIDWLVTACSVLTLIRSRSARGFYCTGIKPAARWHNGVETNVVLDMLEERRFIYFCLNGGSIFYLAWVFLYKYSKRYGTLQRHYYFAFPKLHVKICLRVCSTRVMGLVTFSKSPSYTLSPTHHSLGCKPIPASEPSIARTIRLPATGSSSNRTRSKSQKRKLRKIPTHFTPFPV